MRDIKSRAKLFSLLLDVSNLYSNINITLSMRDNILTKSFRDLDELRSGNLYTEIDVNSESFDLDLDESQAEFSDDFDNISIYKLLWSEKRIVDDFIPSLLHGWNMKIDLQSEKELERFISRSTKSLNRSSRGSRIFLKSPLRAVWLVRFVYDQSVILDDMDLSEFENEILRLSVKNRFESRRLKIKYQIKYLMNY